MAPATDDDGGVVAEILSKHGNSAQPESRQVVAILTATSEVIVAEGLSVSPISIFAASMSALERPETIASAQVSLSICTLLGFVLPRVPNATLRSKFNGCSRIFGEMLSMHKEQAPVAKAALHCLTQVLSALDPSNWPAASAPFCILLSFVLDPRPKVRKRAQQGLSDVLASLQGTPALAHASETIAQACQVILTSPEAASRAAASASNKNRSSAEASITKAVQDTLHMIGSLKSNLPLMAGSSVKLIVDLLFKLYPLKQALLSRHTTEALTALCSASSSHLSPQMMAELLLVIVDSDELVWNRRDVDTVMSLTRLVESGFIRLHEMDAQLCAAKLPRAFHALVPQICAEQDGVRFGTSQALRNLIIDCIDADMVLGASSKGAAGGKGGAAAPIVSVIAAVCSLMGAMYQESWVLVMPVVGTLIERLGALGGVPLASQLVHTLGALLAGAADADEGLAAGADAGMGGAGGSEEYAQAAQAAMGAALRALGPDAVLSVLPLQLKEALDGAEGCEARTWMLPLLRRHIRGAPLAYWGTHLQPMARMMATRAEAATKAGKGQLAQSCHMLELQIWHCLPAFVSWAPDLGAAYPSVVKDMAGAFQNREDLRPSVCQSLQRMCLQIRKVLKSGGHSGLIGFSEPIGVRLDADEEDDDDDEDGGGEGGDEEEGGAGGHDVVPEEYSTDSALAAAEALRKWSRNWLPLMFKTFLELPAEARGHVAEAISAYASISDAASLAPLFRSIVMKLIKIVNDAAMEVPPADMVMEGGTDPLSRRCSFIELALCCAAGLDDTGLATLYKAAKPGLADPEPAVQKKAYKVLAYICEQRPSFVRTHIADIMQQVVSSTAASLSAAKRYRLRCLKPLALVLSDPDCPDLGTLDNGDDSDSEEEGGPPAAAKPSPLERRSQLVSALVAEIVLCCKEANKKTRTAAYGLLVQLAHSMDEAMPGHTANADEEYGFGDRGQFGKLSVVADTRPFHERGGLYNLMTMVMAGMVGSTPHMISATIIALARLLFEFASQLKTMLPELLPAVLMLLRSKSREVIKSVLGFVKVCVMRMPVELLMDQMGEILEGVLLWCNDSKNKFKLKVRVIVERLARRCGFDSVAAKIPASEAKLLTHIRKEFNKKQRKRGASEADGDDIGDDDDADGTRSQRSAGRSTTAGRTAAGSTWGHTQIFGDDEGGEDDGRTVRSARTKGALSEKRGTGAAAAGKAGGRAALRLFEGKGDGDDPMNLLDASAARQLVKTAAGVAAQQRTRDTDDFKRGDGDKMIINDEDDGDVGGSSKKKRKRPANQDYDSDDSDFDDLRSIGGLSQAMKAAGKSVHFAKSVAQGSAISKAVSNTSKASRATSSGTRDGAKPTVKHSGDRFKAKGKATGGDTKGRSKVEPYAYWQFDRKMLNRRKAKHDSATKSLGTVVKSAKSGGVLKGAKAKGQGKRMKLAGSGAEVVAAMQQ